MSKNRNKTSAEVYGEIAMDVAAVTCGVVFGLVGSYQLKKLASKATNKDGQQPAETSIVVKLAPTLIGAAATYGAAKSDDRHLRLFCIGAASTASAVSLFSLVGNDTTSKYVGVSLGNLPEELEVLPTHQAMEYEAGDGYEETPYVLNLPPELDAPDQSYSDAPIHGLAVLPNNSEAETVSYVNIL